MENQDVKINAVQRTLCERFHLVVERHDDIFTIIDRDPALKARKVKYPRYSGTDLDSLMFQARTAQNARNRVPEELTEEVVAEEVAEEVVEPVSEIIVEEAEKIAEVEEAVAIVEADQVSNVVPLRRAVLTAADREAPSVLTNVILDNTGQKTPRVKKEGPGVKKERKHRDNRLARAFRAIIENPEMNIVEQAAVADVTVDMLGWYHIALKSVYRIIYEKHGEGIIPNLPALNKVVVVEEEEVEANE